MAWETAELIDVFRLTIPAMADVTDAELASDIETYRDYISEKVFGKLFPKALAYFIAHMRTLNGMISNAVAGGSGAGAPIFSAGTLVSEKESDLQRSYSAGSSSATTSTNSDELLKKTLYGQMFLQLKEMVVVTAVVRRGKRRCFI